MPKAFDLKTFVPSKNYEDSLTYYQALGWKLNWKQDGLSEMELGGRKFFLQNYYHKGWANNFMMYIDVNSAQEWYDHIVKVLNAHKFKYARVKPPKQESYALVTYAWDPSGVLLHFAQSNEED